MASVKDEIKFYATSTTRTPHDCNEKENSTPTTHQQSTSIPVSVNRQQYSIEIQFTRSDKQLLFLLECSTPGSFGYDIRSPKDTSIPPNSQKLIQTSFSLSIQEGLYGRIAHTLICGKSSGKSNLFE